VLAAAVQIWDTSCVHCVKVIYQLSHSEHSSCPNSARLQSTQPGTLHMQLFT